MVGGGINKQRKMKNWPKPKYGVGSGWMKNKPAALLVTRKKQLVENSIMAGAAGFVVVARLFLWA